MNEFKLSGEEGDPLKDDSDSKVSDGNSVHKVSEGMLIRISVYTNSHGCCSCRL